MLIRLLTGVAAAVLLAVCFPRSCGAAELSLSERVLFSAERDAAPPDRSSLIPDISEFGFDTEDASPEAPENSEDSAAVEPAVGLAAASVPGTVESHGRGTSENAYASMAPPEDSCGKLSGLPAAAAGTNSPIASPASAPGFHDAVNNIPSGDLPPLLLEAAAGGMSAAFAPPPRREVRVRAGGEALRSRQDPSLLDSSAYSMTGTKYTVGIDFDWSVDTSFGLSLDMLDATVKSALPYDSRRADIRGVFAGASVDTVLFDSYLVGLKGFYGRLDSAGGGTLASPDDGGATSSRWREPEHRSDMYGLSASLRVPAQFGDYRVVFDSGVTCRRIDTGSYSYRVDASGPRDTPGKAFSSDSFALPAGVSVERDFITPWALFTPRFGAGSSYEFSDTANGLRSLHALSAMPVYLQSNGFHRTFRGFVSTAKLLHHVSLGLDVATVNGWDMRVDYRRDFAGAYSRDSFSAELGRSF